MAGTSLYPEDAWRFAATVSDPAGRQRPSQPAGCLPSLGRGPLWNDRFVAAEVYEKGVTSGQKI